MLTKEQLTDAHEQGLSINTRNGNIKIVTILGDVYGVNHCDTNSKLVKWWMFENFERNEAKIEQPKPKYSGRAVKCDTVEQHTIVTKIKNKPTKYCETNFNDKYLFIDDEGNHCNKNETIENNYEIISFADFINEHITELQKLI